MKKEAKYYEILEQEMKNTGKVWNITDYQKMVKIAVGMQYAAEASLTPSYNSSLDRLSGKDIFESLAGHINLNIVIMDAFIDWKYPDFHTAIDGFSYNELVAAIRAYNTDEQPTFGRANRLVAEAKFRTTNIGRAICLSEQIAHTIAWIAAEKAGKIRSLKGASVSSRDFYFRNFVKYDDTGFFTSLLVTYALLYSDRRYQRWGV